MPHRNLVLLSAGVASALIGLGAVTSAAAPPAPCTGTPQITDPVADGHHAGTDVIAAWLSEESGRLQAVIQVRAGIWAAEHDDAEVNGAGYAFLFTAGGQVRYVRANAPAAGSPSPVTYDYGTYTPAGGFASAGATTGSVVAATDGTVTIDVPAATGAVAGATLANPYVRTYDGITGGVPAWVDRAPGAAMEEPSYGADFVVGACGAPASGGTAITAVNLSAPARTTGARTVTVRGTVVPARGGVPVTLTRAARSTATSQATTAADGSFSARVRVGETTRLRAVAAGVGSQELTVRVRAKVRIAIARRADGSALVTGRVDPKLPGRVLWLRADAVRASARTTTRNGTFRLRLKHPLPGRYQAVVIPGGARAERATSNTGVIR